jgi:hypothetical protein
MAEINGEIARVVNTTLVKYFRDVEDQTSRNRRLPALLKEKGRYSYGHSGREMEIRERFKRHSLTGYGDMDIINFARHDLWKRANLDWRGYVMSDSYSEKEKLMNRGTEGVIKYFTDLAETLKEDFDDQFSEEFYRDGNASGNEKLFHGIESFMGQTTGAANGYKLPDDSFGQLDTDPGAYGGTWTGTWPNGTGPTEYDFWSPIIIDDTDADAFSDGATWALNCVQVLGQAAIDCLRSGSKEGELDVFMVDRVMFAKLKDKLRAKEQINVERGGQDSGLVKVGFKNVVNVDGVDVTWEYGAPADTFYGFNCDKMQVRFMYDERWKVHGPVFREDDLSWRTLVATFGNIWWQPRHFCKGKNYT